MIENYIAFYLSLNVFLKFILFIEDLASPSIVDVRKEISKYGRKDGYNKYMSELMDTKVRLEGQRVF